MAASRVFVKGLPPSLTEEDFQGHFAKRYNVTDVKFFQQRRIGYVGFKTPQDASSAVKYFNKSFIRMSRISVELADSVIARKEHEHPTSLKSGAGSNSAPIRQSEDSPSLKRKRNEVTEDKNDAKLKEYLGLMQPPSKIKTWQDVSKQDNREALDRTSQGQETVPDVEASSTTRDEQDTVFKDMDSVPRQVKSSKLDTPDVAAIAETEVVNAPEVPSTLLSRDEHIERNTASDMDWMRSRTSRLLGLVEDDDEIEQAPPGWTEEQRNEPAKGGAKNDQPSAPEPDDVLETLDAENLPDAPVEAESDPNLEAFRTSGRLFLRNLSYAISEADLRELFSSIGPLREVHLPLDTQTGNPKGFAFVQFEEYGHAVEALQRLDGTIFQGRLLHILPGAVKRDSKLDDFAISKLPLKKQRQIQKKSEATSSTFNWNSMYMNADAVISSISDRLGVAKSELLDPSSSDAAVKLAQAETHVIQETKAYFDANGVNLDAFSSRERGDTAILVKNFTYGTKTDEIKKVFAEFGDISKILMPPSGTIAIVEFRQVIQARAAFNALAYRKFKDSVLFLEKAPKDLFRANAKNGEVLPAASAPKPSTTDLMQKDADDEVFDTSTLFVRNLSFATNNEGFRELFQPLDGFISARVKTKPDPKKAGSTLSMGFGFLEFRSSAQAKAALAAMNGYNLDGHQLLIKASHKGHDAAEERKKEDQAKRSKDRKSKIIIKNLPFEASKKDITNLFKAYGQLKTVRVPKKFDNSRKGYAFAEFTTPREAENAMDALRDTHLLGRRLVLDFAAGEADDPEKEIEKMQQKVGRQSNSIALQRLTASERKKFTIGGEDEEGGG